MISMHICLPMVRAQWANADQNEHFFIQAKISDRLHKLFEAGNIKTILGLNKICSGLKFFRQSLGPPVEGGNKGVSRRAQE
jgi:hypothetical protein